MLLFSFYKVIQSKGNEIALLSMIQLVCTCKLDSDVNHLFPWNKKFVPEERIKYKNKINVKFGEQILSPYYLSDIRKKKRKRKQVLDL